jgi:dienelactone hydrolase
MPVVAYTLPPYAKPSSFIGGETTIGSGQWALPVTVTVPVGTGPWPAVVLVHGSGPNDRDETVGASKPFKDLATGLASRGIAVLRYDKRTMVHGPRIAALKEFTVREEVIEDVLEALKALRARPGIDPARVFVLGHSLGGMLIPRIATADPTIAGLIVLAGPARPLEEALVAQTRYIALADGTISAEEPRAIDQAAAVGESIRGLTPEDTRSGRTIAGAPASYWLDLRGYDPPSEARRVKSPMLLLHGDRDYQVTAEEFGRWKAALGSRPDVTFRSYPALNHLFIAGTGPGLPAEYQVPATSRRKSFATSRGGCSRRAISSARLYHQAIDDVPDASRFACKQQRTLAFGPRSHAPAQRHDPVLRVDVDGSRLNQVVERHLRFDLRCELPVFDRLVCRIGGSGRALADRGAGIARLRRIDGLIAPDGSNLVARLGRRVAVPPPIPIEERGQPGHDDEDEQQPNEPRNHGDPH